MGAAQRNFHVPLSQGLYESLHAEARRSHQPATMLARQAIEELVRRRQAEVLHQEIVTYASEASGSDDDLDPALEAAGIESLLDEVHG
jgi:hypothetical protein